MNIIYNVIIYHDSSWFHCVSVESFFLKLRVPPLPRRLFSLLGLHGVEAASKELSTTTRWIAEAIVGTHRSLDCKWAMKKGPWLFRVFVICRGLYYPVMWWFLKTMIRIPTKQPQWKVSFFFSWLKWKSKKQWVHGVAVHGWRDLTRSLTIQCFA